MSGSSGGTDIINQHDGSPADITPKGKNTGELRESFAARGADLGACSPSA
ncbi:MAG: hypothetical protein Cons2KO_15760 [Congregibacter sp.]